MMLPASAIADIRLASPSGAVADGLGAPPAAGPLAPLPPAAPAAPPPETLPPRLAMRACICAKLAPPVPPPPIAAAIAAAAAFIAAAQGLTLVHCSAQQKHFLGGSLFSFSEKNGSG